MKTKIVLLMAIICASNVYGNSISAIFINGKANISIDGNLTDFNLYHPIYIPVTQHNEKYSKINKWTGERDLSGSFACIADNDFVFIGMNVIDDKLIFSDLNNTFLLSHPYLYDCIELFLYYENNFQPLHVWVTSDNNMTRVIGQDLNKSNLPNFYMDKGVVCSLKPHESGYYVEIAIPINIMTSLERNSGRIIGINVGIYDDDDEGGYDNILELTKIWDDNIFKIMFNNTNVQVQSINTNCSDNNIKLVLNDNNYAVEPEVLLEVARTYENAEYYSQAEADYKTLITQNKSINIVYKAKLGLARIYLYNKKYTESRSICDEILNNCDDKELCFDASMIVLSIGETNN